MATKGLSTSQPAECVIADYVDDHPNSPDSGVVSHHGDDESLSATNSPVKFGHYYHHHVRDVPTQIVRPLQTTAGSSTSSTSSSSGSHSRCVASQNGDDESQLSFADSGAGSEDSLSIASSSRGNAKPGVIKFHCKWTGCQWPGCEDDIVDHIVEHLPKASSSPADDDDTSTSEFVCKWIGCKVFNVPFKKSQTLHDHCIARHCGDNPFKCIVDGCCARFKSIKLRQKHVDDHFRITASSSKAFAKKTFSSSSSSKILPMISKTRSLSSSVSTDSVISSSSSSAISGFYSSSGYSSSSSTANASSPSSSSSISAAISYRFHQQHQSSHSMLPPPPPPMSQTKRRCQDRMRENCCCTCSCHSCYICTSEVYVPSRCKDAADHTIACCNRPAKKLALRKKRKHTASYNANEAPDYRLTQVDDYYTQKRDLLVAGVSSAYTKAGTKRVFNMKLFQVRPGYVEFSSEVVEEFTDLKDGKRLAKCKLSWSPANFIPDSVILKADLEKNRTKFVSELSLQRLEDQRKNLYARKRRR